MARLSRKRLQERDKMALARSRRHKNENEVDVVSTFYVSCGRVLNRKTIIDALFDDKGRLRVNTLGNDLLPIEPVMFANVKLSGGGHDVRFQIDIQPSSSTFESIKLALNSPAQDTFHTSEVDVMKILIGGSRDQAVHQDLQFLKSVPSSTRQQIRSKVNSVLISLDLAHPCKLIVDKSCLSAEAWDDVVVEFTKFKNGARVMAHESDVSKAVLVGPCIIFHGGVFHSGAPCLGSMPEVSFTTVPSSHCPQSRFSAPFKSLCDDVGDRNLDALSLSEIENILRLNSISRVFLSTWPSEFGCRSDFVVKEDVAVLARPMAQTDRAK